MTARETCICGERPPVDRRQTVSGVIWLHRYCGACLDGFWERAR